MSGPLSPTQARGVYDRIGRTQDWQAFYEDPPVMLMLAESRIEEAMSIFELGCGTGRLAEELLRRLGPSAAYRGVDISPVMVELARRKLARWPERTQVVLSPPDGSLAGPEGSLAGPEGSVAMPDGSVDRFISTYVFDLLAQDQARAVLAGAARMLTPDGLLCLTALAPGIGRIERVVSHIWSGIWRLKPSLVGGCRPISIVPLLADGWEIRHHSFVQSYCLVSEVVVASPRQEDRSADPARAGPARQAGATRLAPADPARRSARLLPPPHR